MNEATLFIDWSCGQYEDVPEDELQDLRSLCEVVDLDLIRGLLAGVYAYCNDDREFN